MERACSSIVTRTFKRRYAQLGDNMPIINQLGTIRNKKSAVKKLRLEAICDTDISYNQLERIIKRLKKDFSNEADCKISLQDSIHITLTQSENPVQKSLFEEYISG